MHSSFSGVRISAFTLKEVTAMKGPEVEKALYLCSERRHPTRVGHLQTVNAEVNWWTRWPELKGCEEHNEGVIPIHYHIKVRACYYNLRREDNEKSEPYQAS
ncbi:hypothetical protein Trydic_g8859 [Trypoxylus dichotomus]